MAARSATTVAGALGLSWLLIFLTPSPALAHASYVRSDPPDLCGPLAAPRLPAGDTRCETGLVLQTPPNAVTITFSEPVSLLGYGIRVLAPSGKRADKRPAQAAGSQATVPVGSSELGTYVVLWQVESSDTHPARGQFAFSVGQPSKPAISSQGINVGAVAPAGLALQTVARWLHFTGYALAFGVLGIILLTSAPLTPRTSRLVNAGIGALLLAEPLALFGETGSLGLDQMLDGDVMGDALASSFGRLMGFRIAAALLLWVTTGALRSTPAPANAKFQVPNSTRQPAAVVLSALALGVALAVVDALGQHAATFQPDWLGLTVHALHLISMALWLGGLVALMLTGRSQFPMPNSQFALLGGVTLAVSAITGLAMAFVHLGTPLALPASTYGQALGIKQLFVLLAVAAGWLALRGKRGNWILAEAGALLCTVAAAGLLVSLPPPR